MERNKALAAAAAVTVLTATSAVALAATGNAGLLGFGSPLGMQRASAASEPYDGEPPTTAATRVVTQLQDVYDQFVVTVPGRSTPTAPSRPATGRDEPNDSAASPVSVSNPAPVIAPMPPPATTKPPKSTEPPASTPTTLPPTPPPPPPTTTTTRPPYNDDDDEFRTSTPPPPIPPGCRDPQLEDNGVWNCQH